LELRIEDDGRGLEAADRAGHTGIVGMRERALAIGADLQIDGSPGHGTIVTLTWVPADEPDLPD